MKQIVKRILLKIYHKAKHLKQIIHFQTKKFILFVRRQLLRRLRNAQSSFITPDEDKRLLIFNIFEANDKLQDYKKYFLEALVSGVDTVLIVVNGQLPQEDKKYLETFGEVIVRENKGYDAAAFREGILYLGKEKISFFDRLLLVNDTNVGPFYDLEELFDKVDRKQVDFWGISMGESQPDFTGVNPYGYIFPHIQTFFLVIEKALLQNNKFYDYWKKLGDTDSRDKAIGRHETVFTRYFWNLGYRYTAIVEDGSDSAIYIHPLTALKAGSPIVKYTALGNYDAEQFLWQDLIRESEIPELLRYVEEESDFPLKLLTDIIDDFKKQSQEKYVLIIDGVENVIPQCTRYRVLNKAEQLERQGYKVVVSNLSEVTLKVCKNASHIIIYRCPDTPYLTKIVELAKLTGIKTIYDIDDLVFDTTYTDQLTYTQSLSLSQKEDYDNGVRAYGRMLALCDMAMTSTRDLYDTLKKYHQDVILNRNVLSQELIQISLKHEHINRGDGKIRLGYFSGSITHNENFTMIKEALKTILLNYPYVELHLVGYLDLPEDLRQFENQIKCHAFVEWKDLPDLIASVDINLAPLVDTTFNRAKSEIKWLEAAAVKVPTLASKVGAFEEMIVDGQTGLLATESEWLEKLIMLIERSDLRQQLAEQAFAKVLKSCTTDSSLEL